MVKSGDDSSGPGQVSGPKPQPPIPRYDGPLLPVLASQGGGMHASAHIPETLDGLEIAGIAGRIDRRKAHIANQAVDAQPEQALRVIRNWLSQDK